MEMLRVLCWKSMSTLSVTGASEFLSPWCVRFSPGLLPLQAIKSPVVLGRALWSQQLSAPVLGIVAAGLEGKLPGILSAIPWNVIRKSAIMVTLRFESKSLRLRGQGRKARKAVLLVVSGYCWNCNTVGFFPSFLNFTLLWQTRNKIISNFRE